MAILDIKNYLVQLVQNAPSPTDMAPVLRSCIGCTRCDFFAAYSDLLPIMPIDHPLGLPILLTVYFRKNSALDSHWVCTIKKRIMHSEPSS